MDDRLLSTINSSRSHLPPDSSPDLGRSPSYLGIILVVSGLFSKDWLENFQSLSELIETRILSELIIK